MSYLLDEIPVSEEVKKFHDDYIKHYNFQRSGAKIGMCSKCGTYQDADSTECHHCGATLIPRKVTKVFNPKKYVQESACEIFTKFNGRPYYSYIINVTSLNENKQEVTEYWEVERNFISMLPKNNSIILTAARSFGSSKWLPDRKYADYWFGSGQKKFRYKKQFIPKLEELPTFFDDTDLRYSCIGLYFHDKYRDKELDNPEYTLARNLLGDCWAAANWPHVEILWKMGFKHLYDGNIMGFNVDRRILTQKNIIKYRKILKQLGNPTYEQFLAIHTFSKYDVKFDLDIIRKAELGTLENYVKARKLTGASHGKVWRYLTDYCHRDTHESCGRYGSDGPTTYQVQKDWIDYLDMVLEIEGAIEGKKAFPVDPVKAHDDILKIKNALKNELRAKEQMKKAEEMGLAEMMAQTIEEYNLEKLEYVDKNGLMVVAMKSIKDIVDEGAKMNHCVGGIGYIENMAEGRSFIFSIRKTEAPEVPVGTIEYRFDRGVVQCRGLGDMQDKLPEGYKDTLDHWKQHIKQIEGARA